MRLLRGRADRALRASGGAPGCGADGSAITSRARPTRARSRPSPRPSPPCRPAGASGSGSASAGRGPCCGRSAHPSAVCAARSSAAPTARAASRPWSRRCCVPAGCRVGQTPKPHLVSYRERIVVDGSPIGAADFAALLDEVLAAADGIAARARPADRVRGRSRPRRCCGSRRSRVDVAVVEVGLGGRLDATNAWDGGVAAITNVERDHMEHLGDTVDGDRPGEGGHHQARRPRRDRRRAATRCAVIRRRAPRLAVPLGVTPPLPCCRMDRAGIGCSHPELGELRLGLLGRHQAANAAVALGVLEALVGGRASRPPTPRHPRRSRGRALAGPAGAARRGRRRPRPASRRRLSPGPDPLAPDLLLDGAHNAAGWRRCRARSTSSRRALSPGRADAAPGDPARQGGRPRCSRR